MSRTVDVLTLTSDRAALKVPYVYMGFAGNIKAFYIGETINFQGAVGRIAQHVSETDSNTFKKRICSIYSYDSIELNNIYFIVIPLSKYKGFWLDSNIYRRAVEFLVQKKILNLIIEHGINIPMVSRVTANGYCNSEAVKKEAKVISKLLFKKILEVI